MLCCICQSCLQPPAISCGQRALYLALSLPLHSRANYSVPILYAYLSLPINLVSLMFYTVHKRFERTKHLLECLVVKASITESTLSCMLSRILNACNAFYKIHILLPVVLQYVFSKYL